MDSVGVMQDCKQIHRARKKHHSGFFLILLKICRYTKVTWRIKGSLTSIDFCFYKHDCPTAEVKS